MSGHSSYTPNTGIEKWIDARMPLPRLVYDSFVAFPVPRNLNYAYTFGGILAIMLVVQILTGVVLAMHYAADTGIAFTSVGDTSATSTPKIRAMVAWRNNSSCRASVNATEIEPTCRIPVATPVSASSLT